MLKNMTLSKLYMILYMHNEYRNEVQLMTHPRKLMISRTPQYTYSPNLEFSARKGAKSSKSSSLQLQSDTKQVTVVLKGAEPTTSRGQLHNQEVVILHFDRSFIGVGAGPARPIDVSLTCHLLQEAQTVYLTVAGYNLWCNPFLPALMYTLAVALQKSMCSILSHTPNIYPSPRASCQRDPQKLKLTLLMLLVTCHHSFHGRTHDMQCTPVRPHTHLKGNYTSVIHT